MSNLDKLPLNFENKQGDKLILDRVNSILERAKKLAGQTTQIAQKNHKDYQNVQVLQVNTRPVSKVTISSNTQQPVRYTSPT